MLGNHFHPPKNWRFKESSVLRVLKGSTNEEGEKIFRNDSQDKNYFLKNSFIFHYPWADFPSILHWNSTSPSPKEIYNIFLKISNFLFPNHYFIYSRVSSHAMEKINTEGFSDIKGLILESPFNNMRDEIREHPFTIVWNIKSIFNLFYFV